jgi:hypothetical protein
MRGSWPKVSCRTDKKGDVETYLELHLEELTTPLLEVFFDG